jgi:YVTN family beta-propeller protein
VTVVNTKTLGVLKTIDLGKGMRPMGTAASPDGKFMFVTTGRSRMLTIIDTATDTIGGSIDAGQRPWGLAVSSDGQTVYTANGPSDDVSIVDVAGRRVVKTVPVGRGPWGAVFVDLR